MGKTIAESHAMLKLHEKGIPKEAETPAVLAIGEEVSHWRRNCASYQVELKKKNEAIMASTSGIFTIELYAFPNKTLVYDTGCGTHICNTLQAKHELFKIVKAFHACKQEEGQSVSSYLLKKKSYLDTLECLGYAMPNELDHGKTIAELHAMLKLHEKGIPKEAETPAVLAIGEEVSHWRRNCASYQVELKKRNEDIMASTAGIFTIELYAFPNKTSVYDTGCGTHICNTLQVLRRSKKLKHGALSLYIGNGIRTAIEAI
nr:hypothetical protein [Tanacetum cinerariifolium]